MVACDRGRLCKSCFPLLQRDRQTGTSYRYINPGPLNTRAVPISKEKGRFHYSQTHRMHRTQRNGLRSSIMLALRAKSAFGWKPRFKVVVVVLLYRLVCTRLHHSKNIKSCIASRRKSNTDNALKSFLCSWVSNQPTEGLTVYADGICSGRYISLTGGRSCDFSLGRSYAATPTP